jgi:Raf kinase inhibitor-like YbhB/YbcL family protein
MSLTIEAPAFEPGKRIPDQFSRDGDNVSPRLEWHGAPEDTRSFALVLEDPDAPRGTFRHWAAYDIPRNVSWLDEGAGSSSQGSAMRMARNDWGDWRYDGPHPPPGHGQHHYHFRLFALDVPELGLPDDATADQLLDAAREHVIAEADVVGTFER